MTNKKHHHHQVSEILGASFFNKRLTEVPLSHMLLTIGHECKATIVKFRRAQSPLKYVAQQNWKQFHKIDGEILVFHGTEATNVEKIVKDGFDERCLRRWAFGKGISPQKHHLKRLSMMYPK
jgi:hypothetical protein